MKRFDIIFLKTQKNKIFNKLLLDKIQITSEQIEDFLNSSKRSETIIKRAKKFYLLKKTITPTINTIILSPYPNVKPDNKILLKKITETLLENYTQEREILLSKISILQKSSYIFHNYSQIENLIKGIIKEIKKSLNAERVTIFRINEKNREILFFSFTEGERKLKTMRIEWGQGIAGYVAKYKKPVIVNDVNRDKRFNPEVDKITRFKTRNILAYPLIIQKELIGVIEVLNKKEGAFLKEDLEVVSLIAPQASIALKNAFLYNELEELFKGTIKSLATAVESKDPYTYDHIDRVTELSLKLAQKAGLGRKDLKNVELSAILHDIGKIAIPDEILNKPGKLTDEEYEIIKTHVYHGAKILEPIPGLKEVVPAVLHHHERWDGKGYPYGLKGEKIPVIARIITITDAFDAMSSDRVYRKALPGHEIFKEFNKEKGKQFDPELTRLFLELEEVNTVLNKLENK